MSPDIWVHYCIDSTDIIRNNDIKLIYHNPERCKPVLISIIIVLSCFFGVVICILTEKLNRAIAALIGAVITYFVLIFFENYSFSIIVDLLFGSEAEGFVNLHSLILIVSMLIIVAISHEAGLFQFLAIKLILLSKGKPIHLMLILCSISVFISALLNNILAVIILIPLTITISRILNIDPTPYILTQAILVNIGATLFSISSIPNILITTHARIEFLEFFLNVGLYSLVVFGFTALFFILLYKKDLSIPKEGAKILKEFNVWNLVQNKRLLYESMIALTTLMVLFFIIPSSFIPPDIIALSIALCLAVVSRLDAKNLLSKIDLELIFYLLGIFVIAGTIEVLGITSAVGSFFSTLSGSDSLLRILFILWVSAILSSGIDNIPTTKILIPIIEEMSHLESAYIRDRSFYALAIGANWGDNLTPLGDNILVVNLAEQNKRPVSFKQFFKLGFITTCYQLALVSLIYILIFRLIFGLIILTSISSSLIAIILINKMPDNRINIKIKGVLEKIRIAIVG